MIIFFFLCNYLQCIIFLLKKTTVLGGLIKTNGPSRGTIKSVFIEERMKYLHLKDLCALCLGMHYGMNLARTEALPSH